MDYLLFTTFFFDTVLGQTLSPTQSPASVPGIATLRPTTPTTPPIMTPDSTRGTADNKTDELPVVAVYFIMLGMAGIVTAIGIVFSVYGPLPPKKHVKVSVEDW